MLYPCDSCHVTNWTKKDSSVEKKGIIKSCPFELLELIGISEGWH